MTFNSQICTTREQSERLLSLGLKKETADCTLRKVSSKVYVIEAMPFCEYVDGIAEDYIGDSYVPAWSMHRLLSLLPKEIRIERNFYSIAVVNDSIQIVDDCGDIYRYFMAVNVYGELLDCIEWLIKEGYFNKEYLEE